MRKFIIVNILFVPTILLAIYLPPPIFRFSEQVSIDIHGLPLTIQKIVNGSDYSEEIILTNTSSTPLILIIKSRRIGYLGHNSLEKMPYPPDLIYLGYASTSSENQKELIFFKLQNGESYKWKSVQSYDNDKKVFYNNIEWGKDRMYIDAQFLFEQITSPEARCGVVPCDIYEGSELSRPNPEFSVPDPQQFVINGFFGNEKVVLTGTTTFVLNPLYVRRDLERKNEQSRPKTPYNKTYIIVASAFAILLVSASVVRRFYSAKIKNIKEM